MPNPTPTRSYGGGRALPVHRELEDGVADLGSGLLLRLHAAMVGLRPGQILRFTSPVPSMAEDLAAFEDASGHGLLSVEDDPARAGWRAFYIRKGRARTDWEPATGDDLHETAAAPAAARVDALMPTRLWFYTNYDCNLQCDYCCVVAGPRADPRRLDGARIVGLANEAATAGFQRVFITGGEPTLRPDVPDLIVAITDRLPLTILTNAMLLRGTRWDRIRAVLGSDRPVSFQVSLDSAGPALHDAHRGPGSHARALTGIRTLLDVGATVRLAASLPEAHLGELSGLHALADELGIAAGDRIFRPIALRGAATEGEPIRAADVAPELTNDADGWSWHPISNDPDMRLPAAVDATLAEAMAVVRTRLVDLVAGRAARLDRFVCG